MSFLEILDTLILKPLQLIFEVAYTLSEKVTGNPGLSIIALSLFVNFLALPLYMRADAIQEEEHAVEKRLQKGVDHIKKTFSGDERMMMLQTYYRQNHSKPVYVLRSAVSLFLQIPFFIAAYRFLSGLQQLRGTSFWIIDNLGRPDELLQIGGVAVNVLPIIMTIVNLISCVIFTSGSPLKSKIQLYAMALFFLVFLYTSPSGLVFYWTLNNIFSLVKTIFYRLKNPGKILSIASSIIGIILIIYGVFFYKYQYNNFQRKALLAGAGILLQIPCLYHTEKNRIRNSKKNTTENKKVFLSGAAFLAVLTGALIPSAVIKASPQEFADITCFYHPAWFIGSSFCMAFGIFVFWMSVFYFLAKPSVRVLLDKGIWVFSGVAIVDYMFFGKNLGLLTSHLKFEKELQYAGREVLWNAVIVLAVAVVLCTLYRKRDRLAADILVIGTLAFSVMAAVNIAEIFSSVRGMKSLNLEENAEMPEFTLSRTGKNVIVLMLDRGIGAYIPYIFREKPELEKQFSGFTYYANMVSFGGSTNFSTPSLFGGYEYTPLEMNKRKGETLREKHDEALKVMPVLFDRNDYKVTVCDPPYAGYQWTTDLSIYDEYPEIERYITKGKFADPSLQEQGIRDNKRNFFCYGIFKVLPVCVQKLAYDQGRYNQADAGIVYSEQVRDSLYTAEGIYEGFMHNYNALSALPEITDIVGEEKNTFLMMTNDTTHEPMLLQEPDYLPTMRVDNTEYGGSYGDRFTIDGQRLNVEIDIQLTHYQANMAAMLQLGKWFDYMRENDVYDNTRIIIVSDHGCGLSQLDELILEDGYDVESNYALLLVKDFDSEGFETSEEFMTCGDVPALATENIIENPENPFTGKMLGYGDKTVKEQYIIESGEFDISKNNGNQFLPARWYTVHDDMRKAENWKLVAENAVLPTE